MYMYISILHIIMYKEDEETCKRGFEINAPVYMYIYQTKSIEFRLKKPMQKGKYIVKKQRRVEDIEMAKFISTLQD